MTYRPWPPPDSEGRALAREAETRIWGAVMLSNPRPGIEPEWEWVDVSGEAYAPVREGELWADVWKPWPED